MTALRHLSGLPRTLNPILRPAAHLLPPPAMPHRRGHTNGRSSSTPVQPCRTSTGVLVGLACTDHPQWARNLLDPDAGQTTRAGKRHTLARPRRRGPETLTDLPAPAAAMIAPRTSPGSWSSTPHPTRSRPRGGVLTC